MLTMSRLFRLVFLTVLCCSIASVGALSCNCFNGHVISSDTCSCGCNAGYLPPTCTFGVADTVSIIFYLNTTADSFVSELFVDAVGATAKTPSAFVSAKNISQFNALVVVATVTGYGVHRVLDSVTHRDPWVEEYTIVSAYVMTPAVRESSGSFLLLDTSLYNQGNIVITVNSIIWIICAMVLIGLLIGVEHLLNSNVEELVQPGNLKHRRSSRRLKHIDSKSTIHNNSETGSEIVVITTKEMSMNLNEHRRAAPSPNVSLPMQIIDDFVDSEEDEDMGEKSLSKFSLGRRVEHTSSKHSKSGSGHFGASHGSRGAAGVGRHVSSPDRRHGTDSGSGPLHESGSYAPSPASASPMSSPKHRGRRDREVGSPPAPSSPSQKYVQRSHD